MGRGGCEGTQRHDGIVRWDRFMNHRPLAHRRYEPTHYEHAANCATHALWIMPSALGGAALHWQAGDGCQRLMAWVYGVALCALFTVSTAFHTISWKKSHLRRVEHCFHMFDRVIIYFFIAGTYAPWLNLRELGPWAVHMRWLVWLMAAVGSLYIYHFHERHKVLELVFYSIMAICPALVILSMPDQDGVLELGVGGLLYALGVVFFKSDGRLPFAHAIWHVFVTLGAATHYYATWRHLYKPHGLFPPSLHLLDEL
uniref:monocyte to macrophage differentiation factor 2-like isoform X2 n=1 Tax=Myxine glutinosa TaxID=7769 RepID=UPI00358FBCA7